MRQGASSVNPGLIGRCSIGLNQLSAVIDQWFYKTLDTRQIPITINWLQIFSKFRRQPASTLYSRLTFCVTSPWICTAGNGKHQKKKNSGSIHLVLRWRRFVHISKATKSHDLIALWRSVDASILVQHTDPKPGPKPQGVRRLHPQRHAREFARRGFALRNRSIQQAR